MAESSEKRRRSKNFDSKESELILELFEKYNDILSSKLNNNVTNDRKKKIYQKITDEVNALGVFPRTLSQIKNKWSNMVVDGKKKSIEIKKSMNATGGGKPLTPLTSTQEKIINLFDETPSFSGLNEANESNVFSEESSVQEYNWLDIEGSLENLVGQAVKEPNQKGDAPEAGTSLIEEDVSQSADTATSSSFCAKKPVTPGSSTVQTNGLEESSRDVKPVGKPSRKRPMSVLELQKDVLVLQRTNLLLEQELLKLKIKKLKSQVEIST